MKQVQSHMTLMRGLVRKFGSQQKTALYFGIGQSTVSRICNGKQEMPRALRLLAKIKLSGAIDR